MITKTIIETNESGQIIYSDGKPKFRTQKQTANQFAKEKLLSSMSSAFFWSEDHDATDGMTDKEIIAINEQLEKRYNSVRKYLGL